MTIVFQKVRRRKVYTGGLLTGRMREGDVYERQIGKKTFRTLYMGNKEGDWFLSSKWLPLNYGNKYKGKSIKLKRR